MKRKKVIIDTEMGSITIPNPKRIHIVQHGDKPFKFDLAINDKDLKGLDGVFKRLRRKGDI